jgi:hypothetical protein
MAGYGMIILGPTLHYWFNFVSKLFPGRDLFSTLKKMVMGQSIYGPAMTAIFFSLNARLQGMSNFLNFYLFDHTLLYMVFLCLPFSVFAPGEVCLSFKLFVCFLK